MGLTRPRHLQSRRPQHGADTRPTGEHLRAGELTPGIWFDLNSGTDADHVPVRVVDVGLAGGGSTVRIEFVTSSGDSGETHVDPASELTLMGDFDFEEEEW